MKSILLFAFASIFLFTSCEYNPGVSEAFTKYRFKEGVTTISIPGWVIGMTAKFADLNREERELLESIDKVRVLVIENEELNSDINLHHEFSAKINRNNDYEELMTVNDIKENVTIYGKMHEDVITEMVVLVGGEDNALIYLRGEIDPKLINGVVNSKEREKLFSFNF